MVLQADIRDFTSFDKLERISNWLNDLPVSSKEDQVKWDTNIFSLCSDDLDSENNTEPSFSVSDCSDEECSVCVYNRISNIEGSDNDSVFTDHLDTKESQQDIIRRRLISSISIRIQGRSVERVKWNTKDSDLLLNVENRLFPIHRAVISKHSDVFKFILQKHYGELMLQIHEDVDTARLLLEHLYGCKVHLNVQNCDDLLQLSKKLNVQSLEDECKIFQKLSKQDKTGLRIQNTLSKLSGLFFMR